MELNPVNIYSKGNKVSKNELEEIFFIHYNDLFNKLLSKSIEEFFILLKKQVLLHLRIIDQQCDNSLLSFFYEKYYDLCQNDKYKIQNIYNKIINYPNDSFMKLNTLDVYIHCYKCKDAIHKCGNKLIIYNNLFFCLYCKKVYSQHHIKLFCKECNKTYLTTKRTLSDRKNEYFYAVCYTNYHCYIDNEEKIKCLNCGEDLYYNIAKIKEEEQNNIRDIYCIKCKLIFDTKKIYFKCKICGDNFKCEPQIYRNFSSIKKYLLLLVHTFSKGIYAIPIPSINKRCNCDISGVLYFFHHDNGILYQGKKNGKKVIICDCCYGIFKPDNFNWYCPFCQQNFRTIKTYDIPKKSRRIVRKQRKVYTPISSINIYNNLSRKRENVVYNNDFYNSIAYPNDNINNSKEMIQSASFVHNRGLSLINEEAQKRYLCLVNNKNQNLKMYKSSNKIFSKLGDSSRNSDFNNDYSYDKKIIKTENGYNIMNSKFKNIIKKKYLNKENIDYTNLNSDNPKKTISYLNKSYNSNIITNVNNINANLNAYYSPNNNSIRTKIEIPSNKKLIMKESKSVNNLKKKVKIEINEPNTNINRKAIKKIDDKKVVNETDQNYSKNIKDNNKYNNNISLNNNLTQINHSNRTSQKNRISFSPNIIKKNIDKFNNNKKYILIENYKNNSNIYQKKVTEEKNNKEKNKRIVIDLNKDKKDNTNNLIKNNSIGDGQIKKENNNNIRILKSNNNIINKKNGENKIIKNVKKTKEVDNNVNKKNSKENNAKKVIILTKNNDIDKIPKIQENNILYRSKNINKNNIINKNDSLLKQSNNNKIEKNKISIENKSNLERNNIINNEIFSTNRNKDINNNNIVHISICKNENKQSHNKKEKENKKLKNNSLNKNIQKDNNKREIVDKNNKTSRIDEEKKNNNNKLPLDSNKKKRIDSMENNNHKKKISVNYNNINNLKNPENSQKKFENSDTNKKDIIQLSKNNSNNNDKYNENKNNNNNLKENKEIIQKNIKTSQKILVASPNNDKKINNYKNINNSSNNIFLNDKNMVIINDTKQNNNKSTNNILVNNKNNIITNNSNDNLNLNNNSIDKNNKNNLSNSINFVQNSGKNKIIAFNNKINITPDNNLSKSINFNSYNNIAFNLKRNINNDLKNYNQKIITENIKNPFRNNNISVSQNLNYNNINTNLNNGNKSIIYKVEKIENNENNKTINNKIPNDNYIKSIYKSDMKPKNIIYNVNDNIAKVNLIDIKHNNNNLNMYSINSILSNNETLSTTINNKLGNSAYNSISKSTNNNLVNSNIYNNNYNIDNHPINNKNNNSIVFDNKLNSNIPIQNNINSKIIRNDNYNIEINEKIIYDNDDHPKDSVRVNNNDLSYKILNKYNNQKISNINNEDKKPTDNIKQNIINNIATSINNPQNNLVIKQIKKENNNVLNLKIYFEQMAKDKEESIKRRLSFDCRQLKNRFKLLNNQQQEVKAFDSNYYKIIRLIGKGTYGEIYLVQDPKTLAFYALKKIIISDALELKDNQEEYKLTWKLTHANPELKIAKKFAIEIKKLDKYNLVMYVLMEAANCDWEQELLNRQKACAFYTENELMTILKSLVNTLAVLQKKGISHRDVKPQNILCFGNEGYKLTDFGEAKKRNQQNGIRNLYGFEQNTSKQTVRGTELYMSPILFRALQTKVVDGAQYNAYKSDVFSLGMCFLLASSLNYQSLFEIREVLDMKIIEQVINKYLGKLYSKNFINLLIRMLQVDEKKRPDFAELNASFI